MKRLPRLYRFRKNAPLLSSWPFAVIILSLESLSAAHDGQKLGPKSKHEDGTRGGCLPKAKLLRPARAQDNSPGATPPENAPSTRSDPERVESVCAHAELAFPWPKGVRPLQGRVSSACGDFISPPLFFGAAQEKCYCALTFGRDFFRP